MTELVVDTPGLASAGSIRLPAGSVARVWEASRGDRPGAHPVPRSSRRASSSTTSGSGTRTSSRSSGRLSERMTCRRAPWWRDVTSGRGDSGRTRGSSRAYCSRLMPPTAEREAIDELAGALELINHPPLLQDPLHPRGAVHGLPAHPPDGGPRGRPELRGDSRVRWWTSLDGRGVAAPPRRECRRLAGLRPAFSRSPTGSGSPPSRREPPRSGRSHPSRRWPERAVRRHGVVPHSAHRNAVLAKDGRIVIRIGRLPMGRW